MKNNLTKEEDNVFHQYTKLVNELKILEENYKERIKNNEGFPKKKIDKFSKTLNQHLKIKDDFEKFKDKIHKQYEKLDQDAKKFEEISKERLLTPKENNRYKKIIWNMRAKKMQMEGFY